MPKKLFTTAILVIFFFNSRSQDKNDTTVKVDGKYITLSEIVVNNKLDVPSFIDRVKNDTTFYKAFRNLHIIGYTSLNDIRMLDNKGNTEASLQRKPRQTRRGNCRKMQIREKTSPGDIYDPRHNFNYYT